MTTIHLIGGPTASGKSALVTRMAQHYNGVVINADAMQLYREIPILTAQPTVEEQQGVPHRLYGIFSVTEAGSVAMWLEHACQAIDAVCAQGKTPILVGGTGMYLRCLVEGIAAIPEIDADIRQQARHHLEVWGNARFHQELAAIDPQAAAHITPGDSQRMVRAWEVMAQTGRSLYDWQREPTQPYYDPARFRGYVVHPPREWLYARCNARFYAMLEQGAMDEVRQLEPMQLSPELPAMKALGIPELLAHLRGEVTLEEATAKAQQSTRRYAKRQVTWFKNQFPTWERVDSSIEYNE